MANLTCKTCGIPIHWRPTIVGSDVFCCIGCAYGGPCVCDYERLPSHDDRAPLVIWKELKLVIDIHTVQEE